MLRRYHNWLNHLPEKKQDELNGQPTGRANRAGEEAGDRLPCAGDDDAAFLQITDVGDFTPFELAALFKIWQALPPAQPTQIEKLAAVPKRTRGLVQARPTRSRTAGDQAAGLRRQALGCEVRRIRGGEAAGPSAQ